MDAESLVTVGLILLLVPMCFFASRRIIVRLPEFPQKRKLLRGGALASGAFFVAAALVIAAELLPQDSGRQGVRTAHICLWAGEYVLWVCVLAVMTWGMGAPSTMACLIWLKAPPQKQERAIQEYAAKWERDVRKPLFVAQMVLVALVPLIALAYIVVKLARLTP